MKKGYTKGLLRGLNKNIHKSRSKFRIRGKWIRRFGMTASLLLVLFGALAVHPVIPEPTENAEAKANPATTTLTIAASGDTAILDITPSSTAGTFSSSDTSGTSLGFSVTTNNITGYNLSIRHASAASPAPLVNEALSLNLDSLETSVAESQFSTSTYVGRYGYKPSKLNSQPNSNYIPAPTTTPTTINVTQCANNTTNCNTASDEYTIALGANIDYTKSAGTYTNTFILTAVANNVAYTINYLDNTGDPSIGDSLPVAESGPVASAVSFELSNTTPTRTGYTFAGWCDGTVTHNATGNDTCSGTPYPAGSAYSFASPSSTSTNIANLYAMWNVKTFAITLAKTNATAIVIDDTSYTGSSVTLTYGNHTISGTYPSGYEFSSWSSNSANLAITSTTSASTTITVHGAAKLTLTGKTTEYAITLDKTNATAIVIDGTSYTGSSATLTYGNHTISGTYDSGYEFDSWSTSDSTNLAIASASSASTTITVHGAATLTLAGKSSCINTISGFMQVAYASSAYCDGASGSMADFRDSQTYTIAKINGNLWMTQNLRFSGSSIDATYTNINTSKNISWSDLTSGNSYTAARYHNSGNVTNGYWYNYAGASAMTITGDSNSTDATYDICPKNWRLPTNSEFSGITGYSSAFSPVTGGFYRSGSPVDAGYGYWWSATALYSANRYLLMWSGSSSSLTTLNTPMLGRSDGFYVRCIRSS